jgi:hypothetical protein
LSSTDQSREPAPIIQLLTVAKTAASKVLEFAVWLGLQVIARWRGILLWHLFFLTVWLAIQAYLFAFSAFSYLYENIPKLVGQIPPLKAQYIPIPVPKFPPYKPTTTCWRDRSLDGDCFRRAESNLKSPPHRQRIPEPPARPCRRPYVCGSSDI